MYRKILELWNAERESQELQIPPEGFEEEVSKYLEGLGLEQDGIKGKIMGEELKRAKTALSELRLLRRQKICRDFLSGTLDLERLMGDERGLFKEGSEGPKPEGAKKILARLLRDVPPFVGVDLKTYGPYKTEDVALLPAQNAEALIKRGIAVEIKR